ncbi:Glucan endo-1,3-beta-glucosidase 7 [Apostasia shenzhenica]|uniref:glucan endo-1,3-beta-D-glucosidase n=1 Tax=Apostasia shenzhenica TaxID=1088818 RepID=A0A2I0A4D4_9ASPA|nr:Glucan endo-1,3-beta-glucosidase 7 [Apostasia shenzhenica]
MENCRLFLLIFAVFHAFFSIRSQPYVGINYGEVADNLPPPAATAGLLKSTTLSNLRLYGTDPAIITALAGTNISLVLGVSNGEIPAISSDPSAAASWVSSNILPFVPASSISTVSVGNEVLNSGDPSLSSHLLPAMQNLRSALAASPAAAGIKVSTVHTMAVLSQSDPPSSGAFRADLLPTIESITQFLHDNNSPFMINPYPYFAYQSDPRPETLAFCLFQPNSGRPDPGSGITYSNMFDAQVDAVRAALRAAGFAGVEVVVAETGWPYRGDQGESGASVENAKAYNGNLVAHLRSMANPVETYIFALYDEDLKPGPTSERSFGLFRPDLTPIYDAGILKPESDSGEAAPPSSATVSPIPPVSPIQAAAAAPPAEAVKPAQKCVPGIGGTGCGQPPAQKLPGTFSRNLSGSGAGLHLRQQLTPWLPMMMLLAALC